MRRLLMITTGGTIASVPGEYGLAPGLTTGELASYLSQGNPQYSLESINVFNIDSTNMQPEHWITLAKVVSDHYHRFDGFVITHGTDTMAYTASALSYMLGKIAKPVVLTGSQVPFNFKKTDAKKNLADAARMACEPLGGVYVVFDGKVIAGTRAVKIRTKSYDAFESVNYPYVASIDGADVHYNPKLPSPSRNDIEVGLGIGGEIAAKSEIAIETALCLDVFLLKLHPGTKPELFDCLKGLYKGIVIESFGNGGIPSLERNLVPKIEQLVDEGVAVVVTTQCLQEGEDLRLYEVGRKIAQNGRIILSKDMNTEAIITKLMWTLGKTTDIQAVKEIMETPIAHDCSF